MNVDPKWLASRIKATGGPPGASDVIADERLCRRCGYALRGLPENGVCPECGESIAGERISTSVAKRGPAEFQDLSPGEFRRLGVIGAALSFGMCLLAGGWLLTWVLIVMRNSGVDAPPSASAFTLGLVALPGAVTWCLGLWALLLHWGSPGGDKGGIATAAQLPPRPVANLICAAQIALILTIVAASISAALGGPGSGPWADRLMWLGVLGGVAGALALGAAARWLFEVASACDDDFAAARMRGAVGSIPLAAGVLSFGPVYALFLGAYGIGTMAVIGFSAILGVPIAMFVAGVWSLGASLRWSRRNADNLHARDLRFRRRSREMADAPGSRLNRD
ncbi:MAG: hypothetical protein KIT68_09020 [Phycisphaeraceae bacterium]|nr:hypothetical protein [Phycisphaeraceae bacterium]